MTGGRAREYAVGMCGRFTLRTPAQQLAEHFQLPLLADAEYAPRYNVAPSQAVLAVRIDPADGSRNWARLRWGLIPSWAQDAAIGNRTINARSESAAEKPTFRQSFAQRRCLIVADGFYEWAGTGAAKRPYYIHRADGAPFAFAGLWDRWTKGDAPIESCTILTTNANAVLTPLHERMPVILQPSAYVAWLDPRPQSTPQLQTLLSASANDALVYYPVGKPVNSPAHDTADCLTPQSPDSSTEAVAPQSPARRRSAPRSAKPGAGQGWLPLSE